MRWEPGRCQRSARPPTRRGTCAATTHPCVPWPVVQVQRADGRPVRRGLCGPALCGRARRRCGGGQGGLCPKSGRAFTGAVQSVLWPLFLNWPVTPGTHHLPAPRRLLQPGSCYQLMPGCTADGRAACQLARSASGLHASSSLLPPTAVAPPPAPVQVGPGVKALAENDWVVPMRPNMGTWRSLAGTAQQRRPHQRGCLPR